MENLGTLTLKLNRITLRKFYLEDAFFMFKNWANSSKVTKYLRWKPHQTEEQTKDVINSWVKNYKEQNFYQWAIVLNKINQPIGSITAIIKENETAHIGYCLGEKWWGKGIATETLKGVIDFLFEKVKVNRIESQHEPENIASGKVMQKCGLKYEQTLKQTDFNNLGKCDAVVYGLLKEEYIKA
ncbi:MAG: GNAT family N-acetyltransferase [Clostridia bacterium]|nr:GNAT family N-acetyltransferase [Clostridia bacterium]